MKKKYKVIIIIIVVILGLLSLSKIIFGVNFLRVITRLTRIDSVIVKPTCVGKNKQYKTWGFAGNPVCVTTYPDEGKSCSSSDECLSDLCVRTQIIKEPYCRGLSGDYPLCSNGETTVEQLAKPQDGPTKIDFIFCD